MLTSTNCGLTNPGLAHSVLNVKTLVGAFNKEKALVVTLSMIVKSSRTFVWSTSALGPRGKGGISYFYQVLSLPRERVKKEVLYKWQDTWNLLYASLLAASLLT